MEKLVTKLLKYAPLDAAVDQRGANLMHDALPPLLTPGYIFIIVNLVLLYSILTLQLYRSDSSQLQYIQYI